MKQNTFREYFNLIKSVVFEWLWFYYNWNNSTIFILRNGKWLNKSKRELILVALVVFYFTQGRLDFTDIYYICRKHTGQEAARGFISDILDTFSLADIDEDGFREALNTDMTDFEDAVQYLISMRNNCDALITRNKVDFGDRPNVLAPTELFERIKSLDTWRVIRGALI